MHSLRKDHLAYFLCICSPFVVVGALDFLWVGRTCFDYVSRDAIHLPFMHGMNFVYHKWSFPIHGGAGVASHIPVIFYSELAGIFIAAFGLSDLTMPALAVFGVAVDLVFVFIAGAWGAVLAGYCRIPALLLLATSAIFATLPGLNFYWNGYYQIVALLVPVSLALIVMFDEDKWDRPAINGAFYAVGFILAMHYGSVIVVAALVLVFMFYWYVRPKDLPARFLCNAVPSTTRIVVSLVCISVLANGFVMVWFDGWRRLTSLLKSAMAAPVSQSGLEVAAFGLAFVAVAALIAWRFRAIVQWFTTVPLARAAVNLFGRMAIGWTIGVNVFAFDTWQNGFWHALTSAKTVGSLGGASAPDILDVLNFIWFRPWNLLIALVAIGGVICLLVHLTNSRRGTQMRFFAGVLALGLVGLNTAAAWSEIKTGYSGEAYGIGRYFFPLLVGLPAVAFALTSARKGLVSACALLLLLLAVSDFHAYARTMKPRIELWKQIGAEAAAAVDDFLASHPDGEVVCLNGVVSPYQCSIAYGNFWFLNFYVSNVKNPPPPPYVTQHRVRTHYGRSCDTLKSCVGYERGKSKHTLVVAQQYPKPSPAYRLIDRNADNSRNIRDKLTLFELTDK